VSAAFPIFRTEESKYQFTAFFLDIYKKLDDFVIKNEHE